MPTAERTVVHDAAVLTADSADTVYEHGTIVIEDGRLTEVRPSAPGDGEAADETAVDGRGKLALPGLVNAHAHVESAGVQGAFSDLSTLRLGAEAAALFHRSADYAELAGAGWPVSLISLSPPFPASSTITSTNTCACGQHSWSACPQPTPRS
ncbi:amidohydrolase family protein [Streptomonospora litoralis]|uniref:Amidohydrolase-related domain-containing protein n=1 Tax=Streptomonospora litoralis TaxID=2498135 RepID=A0A4V0ZK29_9ACTN|nr:hypothetical protein [Streptomonospora litoralis]QBI55542.1 hypothetical protein EKD16_18895 [Streptomonospora litoralis]